MIVVAGLSPAWQKILEFDAFTAGNVNRAAAVHRFASGKVLNVAIALAHLDVPHMAVTVIGGPLRATMDRELTSLGVNRHWIETAAETRTCITLLDRATGTTTELVENARPLTGEELDEVAATFRHAAEQANAVVLTGSLPKGVPTAFYATLLEGIGCPVVMDARGPELLAALGHQPLVIKPNREELAATVGRALNGDDDLIAAMNELHAAGARWIVVTDGKRPALVSGEGQLYRVTPPHVERVVNPIGSGDCVAAGIAAGIVEGMSVIDAVALGFAAAADNVGQLLAARVDRERMKKYLAVTDRLK